MDGCDVGEFVEDEKDRRSRSCGRYPTCGLAVRSGPDVAKDASNQGPDLALGVACGTDVEGLALSDELNRIKCAPLARGKCALGAVRGEYTRGCRPDTALFTRVRLGDPDKEIHGEESVMASECGD